MFWGFGVFVVVVVASAAVLESRFLHVAQLSWNSLHTPAWPRISTVLYLSLLSMRVVGVSHNA